MSNDYVLPLTEVTVPDTPPPVAEFNAEEVGEKIKKDTTVFEIHLHKPWFTKAIPPAEFIRKIKEAGEQNLTPEQEEQLATYRAAMKQEPIGPNGEKTDASMLRISQDVLDRKEIAKIVNHDDKFSAWIKNQSIPSPYLANGLYQIFRFRVPEIDTAVIAFVKERKRLIKELGAKYLELKAQAEKRRWPFYDENDYPAWELIEARYSVKARYVTYNVDSAIQEINKEIWEREEKKSKLEWANAAEEYRNAQRQFFNGLLEEYSTMLGRDEKGKRRTFRPSAVKKMVQFFDNWNDATNDTELRAAITQVKNLVAGVEVDTLKKDMDLRDTIQTALNQVKQQTAGLVVVRERKVVFDDFEVEEDEEPIPDDALPLA